MYIRPLSEVKEDYNFLMGYYTGRQKKWWCGIENITFIFNGAWSDSEIGYKGYAINESLACDYFWAAYQDEYPAPDYKNREEYSKYEDAFCEYMRKNKEEVFEYLDDLIASYEEENKELIA